MTLGRKRTLRARLRCWLLGHKWEGTYKRHPTDRVGEVAEWCPRCRMWRSLLPAVSGQTAEKEEA